MGFGGAEPGRRSAPPSWSAMVSVDEKAIVERAERAERAAVELAVAEKAAASKAAAEKAAAESAAAGRPKTVKRRRILKEPQKLEQQFTNAVSQLGGPQLAVRMTEP